MILCMWMEFRAILEMCHYFLGNKQKRAEQKVIAVITQLMYGPGIQDHAGCSLQFIQLAVVWQTEIAEITGCRAWPASVQRALISTLNILYAESLNIFNWYNEMFCLRMRWKNLLPEQTTFLWNKEDGEDSSASKWAYYTKP